MNKDIHKLFLIINPVSGTNHKPGFEKDIISGLTGLGFEVETEFTAKSGSASSLAKRAVDEHFDGVLVCGGDGTINETAGALINTGVPLGIIPNGSGNGLARHLDIPIDIIDSLEIIAERNISKCDHGTANGHPFFCTFGIGFDAAVSDRFAAASSRGRLTYVRSAFHEFRHYKAKPYRIMADGETIDVNALLITVCNAGQYGNNAYICPDASITDGRLNLVIVPETSRLSMINLGMGMMSGTLGHNKKLIKRSVESLTIIREDGPAHLDGEPFAEAGTEINITCVPGALDIFTNVRKKPFKPILTPMHSLSKDLGSSIKHIFR